MNLIWDPTAIYNSDHLKLLRSICKIGNKGVTLNQENIYKLFKKYSQQKAVIRFDEYFKSGALKLPLDEWTKEQIETWQIQVSE